MAAISALGMGIRGAGALHRRRPSPDEHESEERRWSPQPPDMRVTIPSSYYLALQLDAFRSSSQKPRAGKTVRSRHHGHARPCRSRRPWRLYATTRQDPRARRERAPPRGGESSTSRGHGTALLDGQLRARRYSTRTCRSLFGAYRVDRPAACRRDADATTAAGGRRREDHAGTSSACEWRRADRRRAEDRERLDRAAHQVARLGATSGPVPCRAPGDACPRRRSGRARS